jgi:hypothetical protein
MTAVAFHTEGLGLEIILSVLLGPDKNFNLDTRNVAFAHRVEEPTLILIS